MQASTSARGVADRHMVSADRADLHAVPAGIAARLRLRGPRQHHSIASAIQSAERRQSDPLKNAAWGEANGRVGRDSGRPGALPKNDSPGGDRVELVPPFWDARVL